MKFLDFVDDNESVHSFQALGRTFTFKKPALYAAILKDRVIVLFETYLNGDDGRGRNVAAYDSHGKLIWEIEPTGARGPNGNPEPFDPLYLDEANGDVKVFAGPGYVYEIVSDTGKLFNMKYIK